MPGSTIESKKSIFGTKLSFFSWFLVTTGWFFILAKAFGSDYVAACSTARRSATEKYEKGGYVTILCLSKITQHNSAADGMKL